MYSNASQCRSRPTTSPGTPAGIIDTHDTTGIIDTRGTIGVFHPAPFGIVDILDAFDIHGRTKSAWSSKPRHRSHCSFVTTCLCTSATVLAPRPTPSWPMPPQPQPPTTPAPPSLPLRNHEPLHYSAQRFRRVPQAPLTTPPSLESTPPPSLPPCLCSALPPRCTLCALHP